MSALGRFFQFEKHGATLAREISFAVVTLMCFSFNIAVGICAGFVLYPFCKLLAGKIRQVKPALLVLTVLSLLFFIFYPYG